MTSDRKIAANRRNARRSSGPRTTAGKLEVSRNALRHGLAAMTHLNPGIAPELNRLATAIVGEHADPAAREQALMVAESELTLLRVRALRTKIFEQILPAPGSSQLDQLTKLERYERRALSRRQQAIQRILADLHFKVE
jgi:hypothetical protein